MTDEHATGLIGLGNRLVGSLPAQFLALALINLVVLGGLFWHLNAQLDARERVLAQLIESCTKGK